MRGCGSSRGRRRTLRSSPPRPVEVVVQVNGKLRDRLQVAGRDARGRARGAGARVGARAGARERRAAEDDRRAGPARQHRRVARAGRAARVGPAVAGATPSHSRHEVGTHPSRVPPRRSESCSPSPGRSWRSSSSRSSRCSASPGSRLAGVGASQGPSTVAPLASARSGPGAPARRTPHRGSSSTSSARCAARACSVFPRAPVSPMRSTRAGGPTAKADLSAVNLAAPLVDGQQVSSRGAGRRARPRSASGGGRSEGQPRERHGRPARRASRDRPDHRAEDRRLARDARAVPVGRRSRRGPGDRPGAHRAAPRPRDAVSRRAAHVERLATGGRTSSRGTGRRCSSARRASGWRPRCGQCAARPGRPRVPACARARRGLVASDATRLALAASALALAGLWWGALRGDALERSVLADRIGETASARVVVTGPARIDAVRPPRAGGGASLRHDAVPRAGAPRAPAGARAAAGRRARAARAAGRAARARDRLRRARLARPARRARRAARRGHAHRRPAGWDRWRRGPVARARGEHAGPRDDGRAPRAPRRDRPRRGRGHRRSAARCVRGERPHAPPRRLGPEHGDHRDRRRHPRARRRRRAARR